MSWKTLFLPLMVCATQFACVDCLRKKDLDVDQRNYFEQQGVNFNDVSDDTIILAPLKLSDEDQNYMFMPKTYRCDGCRGVTYQLQKRFLIAEKKKPSNPKLSFVEVLDIVDELCKDEFKNYGLTNVMGVNMLAGDGLQSEKESGVMDTGGIWGKRMQRTCEELVDLFEEEVMYSKYRKEKDNFMQTMCINFCDGNIVGLHKAEL